MNCNHRPNPVIASMTLFKFIVISAVSAHFVANAYEIRPSEQLPREAQINRRTKSQYFLTESQSLSCPRLRTRTLGVV
jgi:hypothetical protein